MAGEKKMTFHVRLARPRQALGHAHGGGSQFFSMWVASSTRG
jgi:hypothetical protein